MKASIVIEKSVRPYRSPEKINERPVGLFPPTMGDQFLNQSSCITIRNSAKKLKRRDVSFESGYHNIYAPEFSSSSEGFQKEELSSLEISFELNDSYEELRLENCLSIESKEGDKSLKLNPFQQCKDQEKHVLEPLFSVSPKKNNYFQGIFIYS